MGRPSIFICSRRADASRADRLERDLAKRFGTDAVRRDRAIPAGRGVRTRIDAALDACGVMIVLVGSSWTTATGQHRRSRAWDGDDVVALEIERGLQRLDVMVIPVICGDAAMPAFRQLPPALVGLADLRPLRLSDERWLYDADCLRQRVRSVVPERGRRERAAARVRGRLAAAMASRAPIAASTSARARSPERLAAASSPAR